jgi:hypothetical protein
MSQYVDFITLFDVYLSLTLLIYSLDFTCMIRILLWALSNLAKYKGLHCQIKFRSN